MLTITKDTVTHVGINYEAVNRYRSYFHYLFEHQTIELTLLNGRVYYTFTQLPYEEWVKTAQDAKGFIQATAYLDRFQIEDLNVLSVQNASDVTTTVRDQYRQQEKVIMSSYELVEKIVMHSEKKIVQDAVRTIERSRENLESKRRYWRVLNEQYYGLDIHPLMEFEVDELERILYACEHYDENPNYHILSWVLGATIVAASGIAVSHTILQLVQ